MKERDDKERKRDKDKHGQLTDISALKWASKSTTKRKRSDSKRERVNKRGKEHKESATHLPNKSW